ncbi:MAG: HAMP domain-containing sensor histidine kinase, partial [Solirubrobacteraceae bacterium]
RCRADRKLGKGCTGPPAAQLRDTDGALMSNSDQRRAVGAARWRAPGRPSGRPVDRTDSPPRRAVPMLWRVFAANAAVFALAFALLALSPVTIHARIRLVELVVLLVGLVVMLVADLLILRRVLAPIHRLARVMGAIDPLHPGRRALDLEHASSETLALAHAFNQMLDRLEDERRDSSARALAAQEAERLRIARELHDEIGQTLTAVALRVEHASSRADFDRAELAQLAEIVQDTLQDLRRISRELRPEALDELGLVNALITLCERVGQQDRLRVHRRLDVALPAMASDVELAIYRIAQEALTNVMRHSTASEVTVALSRSDSELVLRVSDNGQGLPEAVSEGGGLTGMRERAMLIGGDLRIESDPGSGVAVSLRLSLEGEL